MRIAITQERTSKLSVLVLLVGASLMLGGGFSFAENVESGFEANKHGDFFNALCIYRLVAE